MFVSSVDFRIRQSSNANLLVKNSLVNPSERQREFSGILDLENNPNRNPNIIGTLCSG
jgi:hypothetical protein